MISLNEVYFGKNQNLIRAEKALGEVRAKYIGRYRSPEAGRDKYLLEYRNIMAEEFGFKEFYFDMVYREIANAGTLPVSRSLDIMPQYRLKKNLIVDNTGYHYRKEAGYCYFMLMYSGLMFNPEFTDEEMQAIIMHEVGHNFYDLATSFGYYTTDAITFLSLVTSILQSILSGRFDRIIESLTGLVISTNISKSLWIKADKIITDNEILFTLAKFIGIYQGIISDLVTNVQVIIRWFTGMSTIPINIFSNIVRSIADPSGYANEKFADNFSTMYGYGPALISALQKMDRMQGNITVNKLKMSNDLTRAIDFFMIAPVQVMSSLFDEHPIVIERARDQQRYLERELNKENISSEVKTHLLDNAKEVNASIDKFIDTRNKLDDHQVEDFRRIYQVLVDRAFSGDFRHNIDIPSKNLKTDIDKRYEKIKLI